MAFGVLDLGFDNIFGLQASIGSDDPRQIVIRDFIYKRLNAKDCISLDFNLKEAKDSLAYIKAERLNGYKMNLPNQPLLVKEGMVVFRGYMTEKASDFFKKNTNINSYYGKYLGDNILPNAIKVLENTSVDLDCRNEIEKIRLEESGKLLTKQSVVSEKNVLPANYKEQYIYIGLGSLVLLVGLYIVAKK